ncbi:formamidopyrimidine/5-formyluracil/ 5-hydroxymethyluracil DNA glycosylase [Nitratireductor indicus C115]|uniref:Formamidopyrimidine-DNA glycosylase n=1 Tax=Nitratireductor indicus C115 TaxID=1231190 RepID=K2PB18_9HYPH|nr:bifunctional DNA-formamidopyrimidine glycosylase/DNA-(apurinic or apyrimidinic site) lyase [Nitratireductor indicus]EKF44341.1 formamidopyrimidine/5-formyluracil/ 5-hydroxymethyluracil DNA glycosylase [Nitratireductor indicus C115]SFQ27753.1 DNA-(apurinic or apyrimidinic site) lyase [Nitratireductor indicus]
MPELPEVETVRRGLQPVMEGARIRSVELRRPNLRFPFPEDFAKRLENRRIIALGRRAKYLLMHIETADAVICHLGMSGSFRIEREGGTETPGDFHHERSKAEKHDHAIFHLEGADGSALRVIYNDPRRFGFMLLHDEGTLDSHPLLSGLGVEPTGNVLDGAHLSELLKGRNTPLKSALMDQRLVAGLGNIYVCEALWRAGLSPKRAARTIVAERGVSKRALLLAEAIRSVIAEAIAAGGSSLKDYVQADGSLGYFQHTFNVYDREGQPCRREGCGGTVQRIVQAGRSTFYCPSCQR